jgi:hypothetical protein
LSHSASPFFALVILRITSCFIPWASLDQNPICASLHHGMTSIYCHAQPLLKMWISQTFCLG